MILVHVGEKLIILFDNQSTVTVEPFFDSRHDLTIEIAPGRDLTVAEFASTFTIITDTSSLPANGVGNGNVHASGAYFSNPVVDPLPPVPTNQLLPPEELPNLEFTRLLAPALPPLQAPELPENPENPSLTITKDATVPGGTADVAGEVISYTITVANTGNTTLTGVTVTDPYADPGSIVLVADVASADGELDVGETWTYTAAHTVTQAEIDSNGGGDGLLENTATADSNETGPDTDDASVAVVQSKILHIEKDASVPGGTADVAGETISYTLAVTNQGNAAIAGVVVDDPFTTNEAPVLSGGFNAGDTDQDGLLDVGETWQYTASHTVTQAELDAGADIVNTATVTGTGATTRTRTT